MKTWLRLVLLTLSVGGGFTGFSVTLSMLLHPAVFRLSNTLMTLCFLLMYAFVIASGLVFAAKPDNAQLLFVAFALQIPYVVWPFLVYKFAAGFFGYATVGKLGLYLATEYQLGAAWTFGFNTQDEPRIGVNLIALAALILLWRTVHASRNIREISSNASCTETSSSAPIH